LTAAPGSRCAAAGLDLWHPSGNAARRLALGAAAGPGPSQDSSGPVDIALVAPGPGEFDDDWLARSIELAAERLSNEGLVWIIVPGRLRRSAERAAKRSGLAILESVLTVPPWPGAAHLIPIAHCTLLDAGVRHLGLSPAVSRCAALLAQVSAGMRLLRRTARGCALLAAHASSPEPLSWLGQLDGRGVATATVSFGHRTDAPVATVLRFARGASAPDLAVKTAFDGPGRERLRRERQALEELGPDAAGAGAAVPVPQPTAPHLLATRVIGGRPAEAVLAREPERLESLARSVANWLLRWNCATSSTVVATTTLLDDVLVGPADRAVGAGLATPDYAQALRALAQRLEGRPLVVTAGHNDLTMANVMDAGEAIGILDWEEAVPAGLPLRDLWYALADALACAHRLTHAAAVDELVRSRYVAPPALAQAPAVHAAALGLSQDQAALGFHACWLHHAGNELDRRRSDGPFAAVVGHIAATRLLWAPADQAQPR
jgi:hypothetical protein